MKRVQKETPNLATLQVREKQVEVKLLLFAVSPKYDSSSSLANPPYIYFRDFKMDKTQ